MKKFVRVFLPLTIMASFLSGAGILLNNQLKSFFETEKLLKHTYEVILYTQEIHQAYDNADAEYLFYLINSKDRHAANHYHYNSSVTAKMERMVEMTSDNQVQQENLLVLKDSVQKRKDFAMQVIADKKKDKEILRVGSDECVKLRQNVNDAFANVLLEEKRLLGIRQEANRGVVAHITIMLFVFAVISTTLLTFVVGFFYADIRKQESLDSFMEKIKK